MLFLLDMPREIFSFYIFVEALEKEGTLPELIFLKITEGFSSQVYISFLIALYALLPLIWIQIWFFLGSALYKNEQRLFRNLILSSYFFLISGSLITKNILIPRAWSFFLSFSIENLNYSPSLLPYLEISLEILTGILLTSQMPILFFLFLHWGWWTTDIFIRKRSYFMFALLIWGALITPPDLWSLFLVFIPLIICYELSIFLLLWMKAYNKL